MGRVQANGIQAKPARDVKIGDMVKLSNDSGDFEIEVLGLSDVRGPAAVAQTLYKETDESREMRKKMAEQRKAMAEFEILPAGRPNKRDRRKIVEFRRHS